ncbi:MAG: hypothetical protein K9G46_09480 [Flavobacteriales bacterium]|jgi:trans-2-enoyl-CoA reductase|nr:hypothetical protein [Flavobacteriales bacterium]
MSIATKKLELIDQLMKVDEEKTLARMQELFLQAEMEARITESEDDIAAGNVVSLEEFTKGNKEWVKTRHSR